MNPSVYRRNTKRAYDAKVHRNQNRPYKRPRTLQNAPMVMYRRPVMGGVGRVAPEVKALDVPAAPVTLNATGAVVCINLLSVGSSFFNRIGRKINLKSLKCTGYIAPIRAQVLVDYIRILFVYDKQTNGALPAVSDILQTTSQTGANTTDILSGPNLNNRDRFVILRDNHYCLPHVTGAAAPFTTGGLIDQVSPTIRLDNFIKLKGHVTQYKADSSPGVIGDIATGSLLVLALGDFPAGTEGYAMQLETRLRFWDV